MATGISSVVTLSTFISLPMSITLAVVSLAGTSDSRLATVLTSKYQKKLTKVMKLVDIVTSAIAVFETSIPKTLSNSEIDEREFQVLQELHLNGQCKMESETRTQLQKNLLEEINEIRKTIDAS